MRKLLKILQVIQIISNRDRKKQGVKPLGRGYDEALRLNPYNPLSYIIIPIVLILAILVFGFVGA